MSTSSMRISCQREIRRYFASLLVSHNCKVSKNVTGGLIGDKAEVVRVVSSRWRKRDRMDRESESSVTTVPPLRSGNEAVGDTGCAGGVGSCPRAQHARAARLLGAAASEGGSIGAPLPPLEQDHYVRVMAALREHLGERAVDAASTETLPGPILAEETAAAGQAARGPRRDVGSLKPGTPPDVISPRPTPRA